MKTFALATLTVALLAASCSKELDVDGLTTNPLDPDYTGTPLIVKVSDTTYFSATEGAYVFELRYRVRQELFARSTNYFVEVTDQSTGVQNLIGPYISGPTLVQSWSGVADGEQHCLTARVVVDLSKAKPYTICGTADF